MVSYVLHMYIKSITINSFEGHFIFQNNHYHTETIQQSFL